MIEKIGNVTMNYEFYTGKDLYSDGDIEDEILQIVKTSEDYNYTDSRFNNWAVLYHLSRQRENIVEPMDISETDDVEEAGKKLVERANYYGGRDNISAVVIAIDWEE